ncbi:hypothetical protein GRZ55_06595 [Chelativorans sp. ZYF759]|uniref:hypothetical protein n=1 Tax=Chelativorans sp. ZYF759 TaxID=2692213 RepID=UPI00145EA5EF|nr:hypothetical protein [Chelativorans sp. ZYF759]NMG38911.1 hypothetical protein [Chelativorans sp. ZYF759]
MDDAEQTIAGARALSQALKDLHRALIRAEVGDDPVLNNPYTMLFALIDNPAYAWMGRLSRMIAGLDEQIVEGTIAADGAFQRARTEAAALIGEGDGAADPAFRLRHLTALHKEPEVGLATGRLRRLLKELPA